MKKFLSFAFLWILALPLLLTFTGAASNQLVLAANHDKFPVMVNERKLKEFETRDDKEIQAIASELGIQVQPDVEPDDGMIDDVHCVMTDHTHLNFLADWIDFGSIYSPGDLLLMLGDYLQPLSFPIWFAVVLADFRKRLE